jgi:serine/threonine protein kinase
MIGEKLGHYQITAKIGKGGMGVVFRATDTLIGRDVALKTIHLNEIEDLNERQFLKERLFREAKSAGILSHPNIVTVYQIGEQGDITYIAMEFVDGPNLGELLSKPQRPSLDLLVSVFEQTAGALDYAHSRGVVHRDIKPGNIIVRDDGVAKIADFGVAKISNQNVTRAGMALGTPHYMSPEQFHGRAIDGKSDQYALAVMIYEIFTGKKPFTADSIHGLMYKILHEEAQPRRDNPDISEALDTVLRRGLAKDPANRFPSCSEFIGELRSVSGIVALPFSVESGLRPTGTPSLTVRPQATTPIPSPIPSLPTKSASTPTTGTPSAGLPPPPAPPAPPSPRGLDATQSQGLSGASAAVPSAPTSSTPIPPAGGPTPPPPGSAKDAVGGKGAQTPPGPGAGGMPPPPPKSGTSTASKNKEKPKVPVIPTATPKQPVAQPKAASKKTPLIVVGGLVAVLLIAAVVAALVLLRPGSDEQTPIAETQPEVIEIPTQPEVPPTEQPQEMATTEETPTTPPTSEQQPTTTAAPEIASFLAEPMTINQGESAKLRWNSTNASYVQISPVLSRGRNVGEHTVTPDQTTTYTLVARGVGGRAQRSVTVTVVPKQQSQQSQQQPNVVKPNGWTLDAMVRALESGEDVVKMDNLMVRVGLNGVSFVVTPEAQRAILAAGERGNRPKDSVVRLVDLAKQGGRR